MPAVNALLVAGFAAALSWTSGPWQLVGGWAWGLTIGPALAAIPVLVFRAPALRLLPKRRAWLAWLN